MAEQQARTVSLQIPPDAAPGDTLTFVVEGNELELHVPEGANAGEILEIQVGGAAPETEGAEQEQEEEVTRIALDDNIMLVLYHHVPESDQKDEKDTACDADGTHAMAWPAGLELVRCLSSLPSDTQKDMQESESILELGSGLGLLGLALAVNSEKNSLTRTIVLSDCCSAMPLLKYNVQKNQHLIPSNVRVETQTLHWEDNDKNMTKYSLIVGSDLLYNTQMIPALVSTLKRHAKGRACCWLSDGASQTWNGASFKTRGTL
jgi:predicted nicotinamide N-methyase